MGFTWPGQIGLSVEAPAASATQLSQLGVSTNGNYFISINGIPVECYVNFTLPGGPYILSMVTSSTGDTYNYDAAVWTNVSGGVSTALDPISNSDQVSTAFYNLPTTRTGLALHLNDAQYFHYIDHNQFTHRALANGSGGTLTSATPNNTFVAGGGLITNGMPSRAQGWFDAVTAAGFSSVNAGSTFFRHGWQHGIPDPVQFGYCRFGWTADQDTSDSRDRAIGIGIKNAGGGPIGTRTISSGYFDYTSGISNNLRAWLYIKN
jgi:hypothetical protein